MSDGAMNGAAIARIEALAKQAQAAHERGDKSGVAVALTQLLGIAADETLTATRVLGAWLVNSAASLCAAGEPNAVLDLFRHAHRVLVAAADTRIDDLLLLWHNLGVFYTRQVVTGFDRVAQVVGFNQQIVGTHARHRFGEGLSGRRSGGGSRDDVHLQELSQHTVRPGPRRS